MRVKRYEGATMADTLTQIRGELGPDAVILQTKRYRPKRLFLLPGKERVEILAATDIRVASDLPAPPPPPKSADANEITKIRADLEDLKNAIRSLTERRVVAVTGSGADEAGSFAQTRTDPILSLLEAWEIRPQVAQKLAARVRQAGTIERWNDLREEALAECLEAIEQLKVYGEIMDIPVRVAHDRQDLERGLTRFADCDLILMDTAGRSQKSSPQIEELADLLAGLEVEIYLVLSATGKDYDLQETARNFGRLGISSYIFSKLDETNALGQIVNLMEVCPKPVSYLTFGQKVPEDIEPATSRALARRILALPAHTLELSV